MAETEQERDRRLGMDRPIQRRDFLNGAAVGSAGLAAGLLPAAARAAQQPAPQDVAGYDPPTRTGMRGSHPGSFEVAHSLRDGTFWKTAPAPAPGEDQYDLVIVGGGISGLAAASFYRDARPHARILVLDNHDDVGGHAKRNEVAAGGHSELINGGTLEIDSPRPYSKVSDGLLRALGVHPVALEESCTKKDFYPSLGLGRGVFFDQETFGADRLVVGAGSKPWKDLLSQAPLTARVKQDIARIYEAKIDYLPGLTSEQKKAKLARISYRSFLLDVCKADPGVIPFFQPLTHDEWGVGIDAVSALDVWGYGYPGPEAPGFQGLNLAPGSAPHMGYTASGYADGGSYTFHFPDGNASIVRLLVRRLIPGAIPGHSAADVVTSQADYSRLDRPDNPVRIRLSSVVVGARNIGSAAASTGVEIAYARFGQLFRVRARDCVLAGYNMMIPYICPDLPAAQKAALHYLVKVPLVYTTVALRNWRAFKNLGIYAVNSPGCYHSSFHLNQVVDIGDYRSVRSPDEPMLVRMLRVPCTPGLDERAQHRLGHAELLATSLETLERKIRDQLARTLGPGGFDPARDITAIAVNRWPHGYAYEYNVLFDPQWPPGQAPHEIGRARFGRITIANSDSGAAAYTDSAIDQAHRAVQELLAA
jgi:spermidine dehydrogenase